ncbi:MAG: YybH family protein [Gemmatimonadaceae bacterium]
MRVSHPVRSLPARLADGSFLWFLVFLLLLISARAVPVLAQQVADSTASTPGISTGSSVSPPAGRWLPRRVPDSAQVRAVIQGVFRAAERMDVAALDTLYAGDSLTVVEGAGINRGWADYRDHHLVPELREMKGLQYRPEQIEVHVNGDLAWALFRYTLVAESGGHTADVVGRGTAVLERHVGATIGANGGPKRGRWVMRHIQTSGRARRPGDPPRSQL